MDCKLMDKCQAAKPGCRDHIANAKNCFIPDPAVKQSPETCEDDVRLNNLLNARREYTDSMMVAAWICEGCEGETYTNMTEDSPTYCQNCGVKFNDHLI